MNEKLTISQARKEFTSLPGRIEEWKAALEITKRGTPVMAILPWTFYEGIIETLEILEDEESMNLLKQSIKEYQRGELLEWEEVEKNLLA